MESRSPVRDEDGNPVSPLLGLFVLAVAMLPYLAASNVIESDESDFGAPRWVLAWIVVLCFGIIGLAILGSGPPGTRVGFAGRWLAPLLATALAAHAVRHGLTRTGVGMRLVLGL
jgi:hypothetical protein